MQLGVNLGYWGAGQDAEALELAKEADRLGFRCAWAAEAYGSDAATVLTWVAAHTERIDIGSAVFQIPARTPAMTAMTAATLDTLSGGRFRLGLGVSGPQVSEGWHGVRYDKPLGRTREYLAIVEAALRRERVMFSGEHFQLPLPDGPGKALKLTVHPVRERIPVYLAAVGPKNLELAGELAQGLLAIFWSPAHAAEPIEALSKGRALAGHDGMGDFDVVANLPLSVGEDLEACAAPIRPYAALYVGGMGSREKNFYNALCRRYGYEQAAGEIQDRYLAKDYAGAMAAVPFEFIDETALLGTVPRIADRLQALAESGVTSLAVTAAGATLDERRASLRSLVEAAEKAGV